jgi:hypothetical protein
MPAFDGHLQLPNVTLSADVLEREQQLLARRNLGRQRESLSARACGHEDGDSRRGEVGERPAKDPLGPLTLADAAIIRTRVMGRYPSDHFPVTARLVFP